MVEVGKTLSAEQRRVACVHAAGHAVMHTLGKVCVYQLAVAPIATCGIWAFEPRKHYAHVVDPYSVCITRSFELMDKAMRWNKAKRTWESDQSGFAERLRQIESQAVRNQGFYARQFGAESRRKVRAYICGGLAGPVAEQIFRNEKVSVATVRETKEMGDDIVLAMARSRLLPYRNEYEHACKVTEDVLQLPEIWAYVLQVADELGLVGDLKDKAWGGSHEMSRILTASSMSLPFEFISGRDPKTDWKRWWNHFPPTPGSRARWKKK